jgi:hypothetical protein
MKGIKDFAAAIDMWNTSSAIRRAVVSIFQSPTYLCRLADSLHPPWLNGVSANRPRLPL